jgi:hypothetical protein
MGGAAPELPRDISPDGHEIWDWASKLSAHRHHVAKVRELRAEINRPERCGDCDHWMKSRQCPREHNVNGRNRGPSMNASVCPSFAKTSVAEDRRAKLVAELSTLTAPTP